jgi:hypothetical protein
MTSAVAVASMVVLAISDRTQRRLPRRPRRTARRR